jgi:hypothetical protein
MVLIYEECLKRLTSEKLGLDFEYLLNECNMRVTCEEITGLSIVLGEMMPS